MAAASGAAGGTRRRSLVTRWSSAVFNGMFFPDQPAMDLADNLPGLVQLKKESLATSIKDDSLGIR